MGVGEMKRIITVFLLAGIVSVLAVGTVPAVEESSTVRVGTQRSLLPAETSHPATVLGPGSYRVGIEVEPGEYMLLKERNSEVLTGSYVVADGSTERVVTSDIFFYNSIVEVVRGQELILKDCTLSPIDQVLEIDCNNGNMYKVGYHIPAGTYFLSCNGNGGIGRYRVFQDRNAENDDPLYHGLFERNVMLELQEGEYLDVMNASLELLENISRIDPETGTMFLVGAHIPAGTYSLKTLEGDGGFYRVYNSLGERMNDVEESQGFQDTASVTVKEGQYLFLSYCRITDGPYR